MQRHFLIAGISLLASGIGAQTTAPTATIPTGFLKTEGSTQHHPAWYYQNGRAQYVYSPEAAGTQSAAYAIKDLWVRGNGTSSSGVANSKDMEISISSKGVPYAKVDTATWNNHGTDLKVFFKKKSVSFPAWTGTSTSPRPFSVHFKGDVPVLALKGEGLNIDVKAYATSTQTTNWYPDANSKGTSGSYTSIGTGCPTNFYHYSSYHYVGASSDWYTYGYTRATGDLAVQWLGTKQVNASLGSFGGAACTLYVLPEFLHAVPVKTTATTGYAKFIWGKIPTFLANKSLFSQMAAFDATLQLKASRGIRVDFGAGTGSQVPVRTVYNYASGTYTFDPDKDAPRYNATTGVIFGRN